MLSNTSNWLKNIDWLAVKTFQEESAKDVSNPSSEDLFACIGGSRQYLTLCWTDFAVPSNRVALFSSIKSIQGHGFLESWDSIADLKFLTAAKFDLYLPVDALHMSCLCLHLIYFPFLFIYATFYVTRGNK